MFSEQLEFDLLDIYMKKKCDLIYIRTMVV